MKNFFNLVFLFLTEKDSKRLAEEKITNYETAFQAIIDCSGKDDISSVVANFIKGLFFLYIVFCVYDHGCRTYFLCVKSSSCFTPTLNLL